MSIEKGKKEIEVVNGDGSDLNISPVYDHLITDSDKNSNHDSKKDIVIPKGSKEKEQEKENKK